MSTNTSFAVLALVAQPGIKVKVLARASAINTPASREVAGLGVSIEEADYDSPESLEKVLEGVEVVVSTLGGPGLKSQPALAMATKTVDVKLFVPSEFGNDTRGISSDHPLARKMEFQATLKEIDLPSAVFFNGIYADFIKTFMSVKDDQILITGERKANVSFTARADVSSFLAHVLTHLHLSQLANSVFLIEGHGTNYLALATALQEKQPSLKIVHETHEEALKKCYFIDKDGNLNNVDYFWTTPSRGAAT
ncbi:NmrA-like family-domain-containing protein [Mrakia frigida]|uniref:NmrA-like family-domain-containing protein n=1 Tax=Mrakia frigida TaxID=29902 RepID=UPI003FCC10BF